MCFQKWSLDDRVYLIQDNASFHKKPGVLEFFAKHCRQIEVCSLPPYPPDFNATERLWHYTRKESTHNRYFDRPAALFQSLFATFADMQRHLEKICGLLVPFFLKHTCRVIYTRTCRTRQNCWGSAQIAR
jgi:hypothetical protein